ncbi:small ribosomal subunit protein mS33-like [Corticium candelabrum]|uniref:small ribosomal subunit protein mS33-like n=1 Tax=Corticium candelabrum TaxID=121492 RepID=UPI002E271C01|nr:small ribosomal subunit protein mS33-like [Corticium candelabrum]
MASQRLVQLGARIFGDIPRQLTPYDLKIIRYFKRNPVELREEVTSYYPPTKEINSLFLRLRRLGLYRDPHIDFREEMNAKRKARGKGPPKKGQGRRSRRK